MDTFEEEEPIDMAEIGREMKEIRAKKKEVNAEILSMLKELTYSEEDAEWMQGALDIFSED